MSDAFSYDPALDDDLFGAPTRAHRFNEPCDCGFSHELEGDAGEEIPAEIIDRISEYLDGLPPDDRTVTIKVARADYLATKLIHDFEGFRRRVGAVNPHGALLRAVAELVDETTGGAVVARWRHYRIEAALIATHVLVKSLNNLVESFEFWTSSEPAEAVGVKEAVGQALENTLADLYRLQESYRASAAEIGAPTDEAMLFNGVYAPGAGVFASVMGEAFHAQLHADCDHDPAEPTE